VLVLVSQTAMGTSWRIGVDEEERTELVTRGIFALVRNPVFTGMGVLLAGQALVVPSAISVADLAVFVAAVQVQVRTIEEPYLVRTHGAAYPSYTTRTGRFVPLVVKQRPKDVCGQRRWRCRAYPTGPAPQAARFMMVKSISSKAGLNASGSIPSTSVA